MAWHKAAASTLRSRDWSTSRRSKRHGNPPRMVQRRVRGFSRLRIGIRHRFAIYHYAGMEGQAFFNTVAGLSVSLAGFASLIAWLRDDATTWDPINLWRVKTIVREAFTLLFLALALIPIFTL